MSARRSFSRRERVRLFTLYKGRCYLCNQAITPTEAWDVEHEIPWEFTRDDSDSNLRLAHKKCHKVKSAKDIRDIRKSDRVHANYIGASKPKRPWSTKFKRKVNGETVLR